MKTIFKTVVFALLFFTVAGTVYGQRKTSKFDWDRVVYGGGIMPVFSNYGVNVSANPFVGYKVTDRLVPGIMFSYQYTKLNYSGGISDIWNLYGISPFVRYSLIKGFFAQAEYEFLNGTYEVRPLFDKVSFSENNLFLGGGYFSSFGGRGGIYAQVMYNVTWRSAAGNSVYSSPFIYRVGFSIF